MNTINGKDLKIKYFEARKSFAKGIKQPKNVSEYDELIQIWELLNDARSAYLKYLEDTITSIGPIEKFFNPNKFRKEYNEIFVELYMNSQQIIRYGAKLKLYDVDYHELNNQVNLQISLANTYQNRISSWHDEDNIRLATFALIFSVFAVFISFYGIYDTNQKMVTEGKTQSEQIKIFQNIEKSLITINGQLKTQNKILLRNTK